MAVRVRKLARQLKRTPWELLGVLHALGYERYRTPNDMLSESAVGILRRGLQDGVRPVVVPGAPSPGRRHTVSSPTRPPPASKDVMAQLVPGVVRTGDPTQGRPVTRPPAVSPAAVDVREARVSAEAEQASLEAISRTLASERRTLDSRVAMLADEREEVQRHRERLESEQAGLELLKSAMDLERDALDAERAALASERAQHVSRQQALPLLQDLLEERGLRGMDEFERVIAALASRRLLRDVMWCLRVDGAEAFKKTLVDRVALVEGSTSDLIARGMAAVTVAPERAEVPSPDRLNSELERIGEVLLLNGVRRVLIIGGRPLWQRVLREGIDRRVEVRFLPPKQRTKDDAESDVLRTDLVVLWQVAATAEAMEVYATAMPGLVRVTDGDFKSLARELIRYLGDPAE